MIPHIPNNTLPLMADSWLSPFRQQLQRRHQSAMLMEKQLTGGRKLEDFASGHEYFGLHFRGDSWIFREWAPNATAVCLVGDFSDWQEQPDFRLRRIDDAAGVWELRLPRNLLRHGMHYRLLVRWPGGAGERIPAYARRVVQDEKSKVFCAQVWKPEQPFRWQHVTPPLSRDSVMIYEAHVGMAQEREGVGSYREFKDSVLPRIAKAGYDTVQLMAVLEHPYYGSFGYHVSNFFAVSSRFGTPEEFKELVDAAHGLGLRVIIDMVHSHAVRNEVEGLGRFDGTMYQYFHDGGRGIHSAWDSYCFNYAKPQVLHFLLSNCRFWLDEYRVDGFRFDGVTSMLYLHHGLGHAFVTYDDYFSDLTDEDAIIYLTLANKLIHTVRPDALTVAEDVSGMPGLAAPVQQCGCGFDFRLAMGVTDYWFKMFDLADENWSMAGMWHELTNRRQDEKTISYVECHDQSIVGGQTMAFRLMDAAMYDHMHVQKEHLLVDRAMAIHKMVRLVTVVTAGNGYLNFMGNEFGHPEWIDFPREGNNWSYKYARRQWSLSGNPELRYFHLNNFDMAMMDLVNRYQIIRRARPRLLFIDESRKVIAFERAGLFFFFNFNPIHSFSDLKMETLPGEYVLELDSDRREFGGYARLAADQHFFARPERCGDSSRQMISLYLPARCCMVLRRIIPAASR